MRFKSFSVSLTILLLTALVLPLIAIAKPLEPHPDWVHWPAGTLWGAELSLEGAYSKVYFGAKTGAEHVYMASPPPPGNWIKLVLVQGGAEYAEITRTQGTPPQSYTWYVRMQTIISGGITGATISADLENATHFFVPPDFSVILENQAQGIGPFNLRAENGSIDLAQYVEKYATLYVDNVVNIENFENTTPLTENVGDNVSFSFDVVNTGKYADNYVLLVNVGAWSWSVSPENLALSPGESGGATVNVTLGLGSQDINVEADGDYAWDNSPPLTATGLPVRRVEVLISPDENSGLPGETLEYAVTVKNLSGNIDNYALIVYDNAGWSLILDDNLLEVPAGGNRQTILRANIPEEAEPCTEDNIIVIATSQENAEVSDNASCIAHVILPLRGVEVSISPAEKSGPPGAMLDYTVAVMNTGNVLDNYDLTVSDNASPSWNPTLDENWFGNVAPGENQTTTLSVTIPENAEPCTEDNITVIATSQENAQISDNASCIAHAAAIEEFMVIIEGKSTAYNLNFTGPPPWVWYENNPPVLAAGRAGFGAIVAGGTVSTCRNIRWNLGEWDVFLDIAFQWMVPGASEVLWYEGYSVYNDTFQCSDLIAALGDLGYSVTGDDTEPITSSLLSPYDILVIPGLQLGNGYIGGDPSLLPDADVDVIVNFVEAGGGLLIMEGTDYFGYCFNRVQNKILLALDFGLIFQNDSVYDDTNNRGAAFEPWCDVDTTTWIGSAYESETGENEIGLYSVCSLAPPPPARFAPPHSDYGLDTDNDNLYNYLVVEVNVSVDTAGWYSVYGHLHDSVWNWIAYTWVDNYLDVGTHTLELRFNGWQINSSGRDGPYLVYMEIHDNGTDGDVHETAAYTHDQFQPPPAWFAPPHSDYGLDTDNDNLYNYLIVEVNVSVDNAGWYRVGGWLHDSEWNWITSAWADNYLDVGTQTLELRFEGPEIYKSERNGPYYVSLDLYDDDWNLLDYDEHETAFYTHDQFQPPPARFDPPHSDYGLDTDNDNLYNYLVVEVNVEVDSAGWYEVYGSLSDNEWNWITGAWADNYLDVGTQTLELRFDGWMIERSGGDGPYHVYLNLYSYEYGWIDSDEHETAFYTHDQFQPPPARFTPPHSDYGLDTDNDNLYNYLVVEVNVSVDTAGWYRVNGDLRDNEGYWITSTQADNYLDVGTQTLGLRFEGLEICRSKRDGPYRVYMSIYDNEYIWLDSDEHETEAYTHDQFQPPPARFTPPHSDYGLDTDNDNLYNYLVVEARVTVGTSGWYRISSSLYSDYYYIADAWAESYLDVGTQTLELYFKGLKIYQSERDGPYRVNMSLYDDEHNRLDWDEHETQPYTHENFQYLAKFSPPHSDYGLDTDNDNLYNYLVVEASVTVGTSGWYRISSSLYSDYYYIADARAESYLDVGTQTLELYFKGLKIYQSERDGPYRVNMSLYDDEHNRLDSDEHETAAYTYYQFQPPPARFAPPHSDYGLDTDNDNLYNYLVVEVNVSVDTAGWYRVNGDLRDNEGYWITSTQADNYLDVGTQTLGLRFEGLEICRSKRDGPYQAYLWLYDDEYNWLDSDEHETQPYTHENFQYLAKFAPPHSDYGLDTDNDNLYNYLIVEVNVSVTTAGTYRISSDLRDNTGYWITSAWAENYLDVGTQTLELRFEGLKIYQSERDGPYQAYLWLYDEYNWLDSDEHETAFYTHDQFQPPPPPVATYIKSAPPYEWTPRVSTTDVANGDDVGAWINLPFEFPFWGEPKTRVWVCSNGFLIFDPSESIVWTYGSLEDLKERWMVAPFWCDLRTDYVGGIVDNPGIYVDNYADKVVITWEVTRYGDTSDSAKFQVVLYSNGDIRINVDNATNFWDFYPTLGISRGDGLYYFDITDERETNKSWFFSLIPLVNRVSVEVSPFVNLGEAGDNLYYEATVTNVGSMADNYTIMVMDNLAWPIAVSENEISLAPGENMVIVVKVTVPENLTEKVANWITLKALGVSGAENSAEFMAISVIPLEEPPYDIVHPEVPRFLGPGLPTLLVDPPAVPVITAVETGFSMDMTPREPWPILYAKGEFAPVGAAELIGNGRVIALSNSILRDLFYDRPELANDEVMLHIVRWLIDWGDPREHSLLYYVTEDAYHLPPGTVAPIVTKYIDMLEDNLEFEVGTQVGGEITPELIEGYAVLQLAELMRPLSAEEIQAVVDYVNDGGGLIIMSWADYGGYSRPWYLNELLEALGSGISFQDDELYDEDHWALDGPWFPQVYLLDPREANPEFDVWFPPSIEWDASITAIFSGGSDDAIFGVRPDATSGFDNAYDLPEPPPPVAPPYVRTFFYYPEQTTSELNRSCLAPENLMEWPLRVEYAEGPEDITLTWNVEDVPADYSVFLYRGENLVADMRAEDNYTFEASTGSYDFRIVVGKIMPFTLELTRGWNMISFPALPENSSPDSIFEGYYVLFRWDAENKRYVLHADSGNFIEPDPDVEAGVGYWAYVLENENVNLLGVPVNQLTLSLRQGWNLIGSPYGGSNIADPADDPDNSVLTWAFTWNSREKSYSMTQLLEAGKGYWTYALRDCTLTLLP